MGFTLCRLRLLKPFCSSNNPPPPFPSSPLPAPHLHIPSSACHTSLYCVSVYLAGCFYRDVGGFKQVLWCLEKETG